MNSRVVGYLLLAAWGGWLSAMLGLAGGLGARGAFLPDPVLCLVVLIAASFPRREAIPAAFTLALGRIAFSIDAPTAILASYLGAALFVRAMRRGIEVHGPLVRGVLCFASVWLDGIWLAAVRIQREVFAAGVTPGAWSDVTTLGHAAGYGFPRALASGALAMALGAWLLRLPGLSVLAKRRSY